MLLGTRTDLEYLSYTRFHFKTKLRTEISKTMLVANALASVVFTLSNFPHQSIKQLFVALVARGGLVNNYN